MVYDSLLLILEGGFVEGEMGNGFPQWWIRKPEGFSIECRLISYPLSLCHTHARSSLTSLACRVYAAVRVFHRLGGSL